jgi:hypothetical protein
VARLGGKQHEAGDGEAAESRHCGKPGMREQAAGCGRLESAEQPQVHHGDRARKGNEREDMTDIRDRVEPAPLADRRREAGLLQCDEDRRSGVLHHLIS